EKHAEDERRALREDARNAEATAKEALRQAQEDAEKQRQATQKQNEKRLRDQAGRSLDALNKIRGLVLEGELSRHPGLESLYMALSAYYDELLAQDDLGFDKVELADGLVKVGDLFGRTGQKARALEAYRKAVDRCRPLAADPKARDVLVAGLVKGGQAAFDQEDYPAASSAAAEVEKL